MSRHDFDPLSFALGVLAVGLGVFVIGGFAERRDVDVGVWLAIAAIVVGLGLLPFGRRRDPSPDAPAPSEPPGPAHPSGS